jgi:hypothetical protein
MGIGTTRDHDRWVLLKLRLSVGLLLVDYEDETGRSLEQVATFLPRELATPAVAPAGPAPPALQALRQLWADPKPSHQLAMLIAEAHEGMTGTRQHTRPVSGGEGELRVPWLLPLFIDPPRGLQALPWEDWIVPLLGRDTHASGLCVAMRLQATRAATDALPLPWVLLDRRGPASPGLATLRKRIWYTSEVARHGLHYQADASRLTRPPHITVEQGTATQPQPASWLRHRRLRLCICAADDPSWEAAPSAPVSTLALHPLSMVPAPADLDPVVHLVYALAHDFALHEIAWILRRTLPGMHVALASNPQANQSLRLSRSMLQLRDDVQAGRLALPTTARPRQSDRRFWAAGLNMVFDRESDGLTEMAQLLADSQRGDARWLGSDAPALATPRHVEMTLESYDTFGVVHAMSRPQLRAPLRCGWRYRLAVLIGAADPARSLFVESPPAIDPLLPPLKPDQAHAIEVCVYAKDFELLSRSVQTLTLAPQGPSNTVFFELRAPQALGTAELRVVLYHRNNLLQSFVLSAQIAAQPSAAAATTNDPAVVVRLSASGVADFKVWQPPPPRKLSVAMNDDATPGAHTLMAKVDGAAIESRVDPKVIEDMTSRFAAIAQDIGKGERFEICVRRLAQIGSDLRSFLLLRGGELADCLEELRTAERPHTVQFARHGSRTNLPWQLLYDLRVPLDDDFDTAPICLGRGPVRGVPGIRDHGCRHRPGEKVICIEGFWALRHRIEMLSENLMRPDSQPHDRAVEVRAAPPHPLVALGSSIDDHHTSELQAHLRSRFGPRLHVFSPNDAPVSASLWRDERRPALLVLVSHLHEASASNPERRVYACEPATADHQISPNLLAMAVAEPNAPWPEPVRPLVLLMACQSGIRSKVSLNNLTDTFLDVGAAAVVGTECDVWTREAGPVAERIARATLQHRVRLGDAMRLLHRRMLRRRDCLSFVFTAYGHADLRLS